MEPGANGAKGVSQKSGPTVCKAGAGILKQNHKKTGNMVKFGRTGGGTGNDKDRNMYACKCLLENVGM